MFSDESIGTIFHTCRSYRLIEFQVDIALLALQHKNLLFCIHCLFTGLSRQQSVPCSFPEQLDMSLIIPTPSDVNSWNQVLQLFKNFVGNLVVGPSNVRVAAVSYRGSYSNLQT